MSDKPPAGKKKPNKKTKKESSSSPKTPKSRKSSSSSPRPEVESVPRLPLPKICPIHKKTLNFYSAKNEELICEDCAQRPNFSLYPASILKPEEAFRIRLSGLYNTLNNYVVPKKMQIESQKIKVETCLTELKLKKSEIEKDMKGEFSAMNERLNFSYGSKQAILQHDLRELNTDVDRINHIMAIIESSGNDQISFLQRSGDLKNLIDLAVSKPLRFGSEVSSTDMPKELNKVRQIISEYQATENLIKLKDEMIWRLIHEKPKTKDLNEASRGELAEWARLVEKYTLELKRLQINCEYCRVSLNEESVNSNCPSNIRGEGGRLAGTGRHYFSDAIPKGPRSFSPATKESEVNIKDLSKIVRQKMIPLQRILLQEDLNKTGEIKTKEFLDVVERTLELNKGQGQTLALRFDKKKNGTVKYLKFVKEVCEEIIREAKKDILEWFRKVDSELDGIVETGKFLEGLEKAGVVLEDLRVFKGMKFDRNGNVEYLVFINDIVKRKR